MSKKKDILTIEEAGEHPRLEKRSVHKLTKRGRHVPSRLKPHFSKGEVGFCILGLHRFQGMTNGK